MMIDNHIVEDDAQKADNILQEKNGDTLEQQGVGDNQKNDGKMHHNTVEEVDQDKQEDP